MAPGGPSVDELASALRRAAGLPPGAAERDAAVAGARPRGDGARACSSAVRGDGAGRRLALEGPRGSGRTTLVRRLAWTLGVDGQRGGGDRGAEGRHADRRGGGARARAASSAEGAGGDPAANHPIVIVDDAEQIDEAA